MSKKDESDKQTDGQAQDAQAPDAKVALVPLPAGARDFAAEGYGAPEYAATHDLHNKDNLYRLKVVENDAKPFKLASDSHTAECTEQEFKLQFEKSDSSKAKKAE